MIILFVIGSIFFGLAKKYELNRILWPILGIASYFGGQILGQYILAYNRPFGVTGMGELYAYSFGGGIVMVVIMWAIMLTVYNKKKKEQETQNESLLDDEYLRD